MLSGKLIVGELSKIMSETFIGATEILTFLQNNNYKISYSHDHRFQKNVCNWYAYKQVAPNCRRCETNDRAGIQLLVTPFIFSGEHKIQPNVVLEITGETDGVWYNLKAYSMTFEELPNIIDDVAERLVRAWEALKPNSETVHQQDP